MNYVCAKVTHSTVAHVCQKLDLAHVRHLYFKIIKISVIVT